MKTTDPVGKLPLVGPVYEKRLKKIHIDTIEDLLHHIPHRYLDFRDVRKIRTLKEGDIVTVKGTVTFIKNQYTRTGKNIQIANIQDSTGSIKVIWFNQPFLLSTIKKGMDMSVAGRVDWFGRVPSLISPEYELHTGGVHTSRLVPIYPETRGVSSKWLRSRVNYVFSSLTKNLPEFLPETRIKKLKLVSMQDAIKLVHFPKHIDDAKIATKRLAFNELLFFQISSLQRKLDWNKNKSRFKLKVDKNVYQTFIDSLPFELTNSQKHAIDEIFSDLSKNTPMNRLLEGDVGSGKTVVAAAAAFIAFSNGYQSIFMAPTQILAQQHYQTLIDTFKPFKIKIRLITSSGVVGDSKDADIHVGTHALIYKNTSFKNVAFVVIDEQHRFGVEQRANLIKKTGKRTLAPHVLSMTATPIPRTAALTVYGDLDLSILKELPKGRIPITTWIVPHAKRSDAYGWIKKKIKKQGIQVYLICPLVEESQSEIMNQIKAATVEYKKIKKEFSDHKVGLLHGRLKSDEKIKVLNKFKNAKLDILVSTPVVEVGIDVPNATIMIIEDSERFGLAQLHQLRGRVGRGKVKSYCMLFTESKSPKVTKRLDALKKTTSGFKLAELDLQLRGPGEIFGFRQHGFPELKIASWQDVKLIKTAKKEAGIAIKNKKKYSKLFQKLKAAKIALN